MNKQNKIIVKKIKDLKTQKSKLEVCFFETPEDEYYLSWQLPLPVVKELISWWKKITKSKSICCPFIEKLKGIEIAMNTEKDIYVREYDRFRRCNMNGWMMPVAVLEELCMWSKN